MPAASAVQHDFYVWDAEELLHEVHQAGNKAHAGLHEVGRIVRRGVEANEALAKNYDTDVVALSLLAKSGGGVVRQIRLLGVMGDAYVKLAKNGKKVIIFRGLAGARPRLQGTRYLLENPKVRCFVVGTEEIIKDAGKATKIAIVAFVVIDVLNEVTADHFSFARLGVNITSHVAQAAAAAYLGAAAGVFVATTFGAPVVITFIVVVAAGFAVGALLTAVDNRFHLTEHARDRMMGFEEQIKKEAALLEHKAAQGLARAGRQAVALEHQAAARLTTTANTVDRYYQSVEKMLVRDVAQLRGR